MVPPWLRRGTIDPVGHGRSEVKEVAPRLHLAGDGTTTYRSARRSREGLKNHRRSNPRRAARHRQAVEAWLPSKNFVPPAKRNCPVGPPPTVIRNRKLIAKRWKRLQEGVITGTMQSVLETTWRRRLQQSIAASLADSSPLRGDGSLARRRTSFITTRRFSSMKNAAVPRSCPVGKPCDHRRGRRAGLATLVVNMRVAPKCRQSRRRSSVIAQEILRDSRCYRRQRHPREVGFISKTPR